MGRRHVHHARDPKETEDRSGQENVYLLWNSRSYKNSRTANTREARGLIGVARGVIAEGERETIGIMVF